MVVGSFDNIIRSLLLCFTCFLDAQMFAPFMVGTDRVLQHLLKGLCRQLIHLAVLPDLLTHHLHKDLQLGGRHLDVGQLFKILRAENIFFLASVKNAFHLIVFQAFFHHPGHIAVHGVGIHITGAAHFADKNGNCHEALCKSRFVLMQLAKGLADII